MNHRMITTRHFILALAGRVGHGKSALVQALTGTDPDRRPAETARDPLVEPGLAHCELPVPTHLATPDTVLSVSLLDPPEHEDFALPVADGAPALALLVVAADDGWTPPAEEYLQILTYLGVTRAVVALTKADLVGENEAEAIAALRAQLDGTPFAAAPIVPTSIPAARGIAELKAALVQVLADTPAARDLGKPRLLVNRVFTREDLGTVVTGTLIDGTLQSGQAVVLQPGDRAARIHRLQHHGADVETSLPGTRPVVSLADIEPRSEVPAAGVGRGDILTLPGLGSATSTIDVVLGKSARVAGQKSAAARPLKDRARVRLLGGGADVPAIVFLHGAELSAGGECFAQLRCEAPVYLFGGDRFLLRDEAEPVTLAGGLVLDADGDRKHWQIKPQLAALAARAQAPADPAVWLRSQLTREGVVRRAGLLAKTRFSATAIESAGAALATDGKIVIAGEFAADAAQWKSWQARATAVIDQAHRAHPEWPGLLLSALRDELADELALPGAFEGFVAELCAEGFQVTDTVIRRAAHRPALPARLEATGDWLRGVLAEKPLEPPSRKELVPDRNSHEVLRFLIETGEAVEVGTEIVLAATAYAGAVEQVKAFLRQHGPATMSELRQMLGSSRRIVVPLCEQLDRDGVTVRTGDFRRLGPNG